MNKLIIDLGSNSTKTLLIKELNGDFEILKQNIYKNRLLTQIDKNYEFSTEAVSNTLNLLNLILNDSDNKNACVLLIATKAFRLAVNRVQTADLIKQNTGLTLKILSAEEEADYTYKAITSQLDLHQKKIMTINIGGGSSEIVFSENDVIQKKFSFNIGSLFLKQNFPDYRISATDISKLLKSVLLPLKEYSADFCIVSGGISTSLVKCISQNQNYDFYSFDNYKIQKESLSLILHDFLNFNHAKYSPFLSETHHDLLIYGIFILFEIMEIMNIDSFTNSEKGLAFAFIN
jgi:exopolyphosphatase/guanosine-5'-triphosphate,3'-diphosphate pyrophosphatase